MSNHARARLESAVQVSLSLPILLAVNTVALVVIEQHGAFPGWLKSAAALFLAF
jgi:hypothetical protein